MTNQKSREIVYFQIPVFLADICIHWTILLLLLHFMPAPYLERLTVHRYHVMLLLLCSFSMAISIMHLKLHERRISPMRIIVRAHVQSIICYVVFTFLVAMFFKIVPRQFLCLLFLCATPVITLWHYIANKLVRLLRRLGRNTRHAVIIGADETTRRLYKELSYGAVFSGYRITGFFTSLENPQLPEGAENLGHISDFYEWIEDCHPDEVYCSLPPAQCQEDVNRIIQICNDRLIEFYFVPTFDGYPKRQLSVRRIGQVNYIKLREEPLNSVFSKVLKRSFDIFASLCFLCTIYPFVYLFVLLGDLLTGSRGPVYFRQARTGYNGKSFMIYKFRSMKVNADADKVQATENDPRKTPFGDFLRRSSIDELPQFINVLKGDMSIIGPRPHMEYHTEMYSALVKDYMVRHLAKPGITGWAQINGCRGETKTVEEMAARVEHDIWYIEHWTPALDIEIFFRTIWQVIPGHDKQAY